MFIPADEVLVELARQIRDDRDHQLDQETEELIRSDVQDREMAERPVIVPISTQARPEGLLTLDGEYTADEIHTAERYMQQNPTVLHVPVQHVAAMLRTMPGARAAEPPAEVPQQARHERKKRLREQNSKVARRVALQLGLEHAVVEARLNRTVGIPAGRKVRDATVEQLERRLAAAQQWLITRDDGAVAA
jgi:hypothetical protein